MKVRRRRNKEVSIDDQTYEGPLAIGLEDWGPNPEQRYSQAELRRILETTIAQLPPRYRIVFQLRDVEGFSTQETAQALALSRVAVKSRLRCARLRLRGLLNHYFKPKEHTADRTLFLSDRRLGTSPARTAMARFSPGANIALRKLAISRCS